jgi:hypothetical protein
MNRIKIVLSVTSLLLVVPLFAGCTENTPTPPAKYNHDMSPYKKIAGEAVKLAKEDKLAEAFPKTKELEKAFDDGTEDLKKADKVLWDKIDGQMDAAIDATNPNKGGTKEKSTEELQKFIDMLDKVPAK